METWYRLICKEPKLVPSYINIFFCNRLLPWIKSLTFFQFVGITTLACKLVFYLRFVLNKTKYKLEIPGKAYIIYQWVKMFWIIH